MNRLSGLVAAYVFEHRTRYPEIDVPAANSLGLTWNNEDEEGARLYLSAVFGSEHYINQFSFYPLICALRRMRLNKIKPEMVIKLAKIKNSNGERMVHLLERNMETTIRLWSKFPGSTPNDISNILSTIDNK
ncbi:Nucleoprotein [Eumeta japonica]|uniref:Nucleoprotein n=1 Tax=Eumeta variegata TaxID=151549 RepID=A0A4C1XN38_EUMVA|nr:Nucleoprotein [Eumeta japonica]